MRGCVYVQLKTKTISREEVIPENEALKTEQTVNEHGVHTKSFIHTSFSFMDVIIGFEHFVYV